MDLERGWSTGRLGLEPLAVAHVAELASRSASSVHGWRYETCTAARFTSPSTNTLNGPSIPAPSGQPSSIRLLRLDAEDGSRHARLVAVGCLDDEGDTVLVPWVEHDAVLSEPY